MKKVVIDNLSDFELAHIFECGQCFRWRKENDGSYTGVTKYGVMNIKKEDNKVIVDGSFVNAETIKADVFDYLDLNCDYSKIKKIIEKDDVYMQAAINYGHGIRILNQDPWEMIISYIISAANNIPRISKTIENISKKYGKKIIYKECEYYLFPTPEELSKSTVEELRSLNLGFRDKYVYNAAKVVASGEVKIADILLLDYKEAKKELKKLPGIGDKVADCILLFSMRKREAFPVDTWIKKVMKELYGEEGSAQRLNQYATEKFGKYGGIAQQYLFYYMREKNNLK
ncbi:MAG: 8-oxoguanine DNA glycosylase [Clostridia bacterium]|nr:8-oxoguanine DNA glycosylase [Clostridia bacterium]